jgi:hypothetical protein
VLWQAAPAWDGYAGWKNRSESVNHYDLLGERIDSIELKCLVVSRGVKVAKEVYRRFAKTNRLGINPLMCNCMIFSDGVIAQLTDMGF